MAADGKIRALIVGDGEMGTELFNTVIDEPGVMLTGIVDWKSEFSSFDLAQTRNIPLFTDIPEAMRTMPDVVLHLSDSEVITAQIKEHKPATTEVIEIKGIRFFLNMIRQARWDVIHQTHHTDEVIKGRLADSNELYHLGLAMNVADSLNGALLVILREALRILHKPAGSIALYDDRTDTFILKAFDGFTKDLSRKTCWKTREGGLTDHILRQRSPTVINDIKNSPFVDESQTFLDAGIKSLVAVPFFAEARVVGILYIDDFIRREWTPREIDFLVLLGAQAAFAIEKFKLIKNIKETKTYLQSIFDNSADIIVTTDAEMRVVEFNEAAKRILGYTREEVVGTSAEFAWLHPEERQSVLDKMSKKGYISNYQTRFKTKNGDVVDMDLTLSYIRDCNGEVLGTVGISRDITEKKRLEQAIEKQNRELQELNESLEERVIERTTELRESNQELERMNKVKSEFIATMSHELRTPLNSILGFSELLREDTADPLTERQKRYAVNIHTSGAHLLQLINNILDLAKIESGKIELQYESFPLQKIVADVDSVIRPLTDKKSQRLEVRIADAISFVRVDRMKFIQILYNLLSNAMKFTPQEGQITLEAEIRKGVSPADYEEFISSGLEAAEEYLELRVTDTGIGIRKEDQARIFSEFEQVDSSYARHYEGTGLGLALTRKLVELHGGRISVASEEGRGSTFTVTIPMVLEAAPEAATITDDASEAFACDEDLFLEKKKRGALVLLVEDDAATAELMTHYLTQGGYRVAHAFNGEEVAKRVQELNPFAVILDIMLPVKDGWQILQELKSDANIKDIPVIILSIIDNQALGFALGAADYLIKPVDRATLFEKLKELNFAKSKGRRPVNILCVDDNEGVRELLRGILEPEGYNVITAATGKDGIEKALTYRPDLIILDLMIPDMDGFELSRALKNNVATVDIPIIILTAKDITMEERLKLVGKIESMMQKSCFTKEDLLTHIRELEITYPVRTGLLDKVSGLFDRSYFQIRLAQEICLADRYQTIFSILMTDIDKFSEYIKVNGMHNGNLCIRKIADFLRKTTRGSDSLVRYGLDEFAILLSSATEEATRIVARRLLSFIETYRFPGVEQLKKGRLTASIAVVHYNRTGSCAPEQMIFKAQELIREAKKYGGGNIQIYGQNMHTGKDTDR